MAKKQATPEQVAAAIKGRMFQTNREIVDKETKKKTYVPHERPMTEDDVLSAVADGPEVCVACADGTKHRVTLGQEKAKDKDKDKDK